ncbi:MAG: glutamine--tRNA ligase/YqeY domain fusion protein [Spirochaetaceae bacterium]|jgi:glutaminyl-tRNA synthetase|nr:glutamine--tRNA ligase/YqeY domain fusion protein [Spirochaetaceae bacterium]
MKETNNPADKPGRETAEAADFISGFIKEDLASGRFSYVHTRFPPEPNGWLHIGHCKAMMVDFVMAERFGGKCNLRFDDTNPEKEDISFVEAIKRDIRWMGFDWEDREYYASDYYEYLYGLAVKIIKKGRAYVDDLSEEQISEYRGTAVPDKNNITQTPPGRNSPWRDRGVEENLDLFAKMRAGEFAGGEKTLRAKIDMADPNLLMRDPVMYRIRRDTHYRTGNTWCIYPMYDFQHPLSDAREGITHSLCSLEYEIHRPLYDWFIREAEVFPSRQIEFARLNLTHTVLSKRYLLKLVQEKYVSGWDDPRMPTLAGLRRRGYTPAAIRNFISQIGVAKNDSTVDIAFLEYCLREDLNKTSRRAMAVLKPLKLIIDNWNEELSGDLEAVNNPEDESSGTRTIRFGRELWIERDDFEETPPPKYFRLFPGSVVRLRYGYIVTCTGCDKDAAGNITAVHCECDPETRGGNARDNRRVKGTIHWLNAADAVPIQVRVYDYLFNTEKPMEAPLRPDGTPGTFLDNLNGHSLEIISGAYGEPCLAAAAPGERFQFERLGYFVKDDPVIKAETDKGADKPAFNEPAAKEPAAKEPVFNKTVGLRDTWAKIAKKTNS